MTYPKVYVIGHRSKSRHPICLNDSDYDYILEEISRRGNFEFERDLDVLSD